ncbi:MAG TPA: hypothetical protein VGN12_20645 [Pirellulales bacterium]|jgi:hypothetical protein
MPEDLSVNSRTLSLYEQAVSASKASPGEAGRLQFIAAAEHALRTGKTNPCGMLAAIIRRGLWSFVSQDDEDRAALRMKRLQDLSLRATSTPSIASRNTSMAKPQSVGQLLRSLPLMKK